MIIQDEMQNLPTFIYKQLVEYLKTNESRSKHQILLDLFQSAHLHFLATLLGIYKSRSQVCKKTEEKFFRFNKSKNHRSFGIYVGIFRELPDDLLSEYKFNAKLEFGSELKSYFDTLKDKVINKGHDENLETLWVQEQNKDIGKVNYIKMMDTVVMIRNIMAHKEGKAKSGVEGQPDRDWPLNTEYFELVNSWLEATFAEILGLFAHIFHLYPVTIQIITEQQIEVSIQSGKSVERITKLVSADEYETVSGLISAFIDEKEQIAPYYYLSLPQVDQNLHQEFEKSILAKEMESDILNDIGERLLINSELTSLDKLVLGNKCSAYHITNERLKQLINQAKENRKKESTSSPKNKKRQDPIHFNVWWLRYLSMINDFTMQKNWRGNPYSQSAMHHALWGECEEYFKSLVSRYLETEHTSWTVTSNRFQQGRMSSIYWGQASLAEGVLTDGIAVALAVSKNMKFFPSTKSKNPELRRRLNEPSALLWVSFNNNLIEDMGDIGNELLKLLFKFGGEVFMNHTEIIQTLDCFLISIEDVDEHPLTDSYNKANYKYLMAKDLKIEPNQTKQVYVRICSPIILLEDLTTDDKTDLTKLNRLNDVFSSFIQVISSIVVRCDSWARAQGITPEWIKARREKMSRLQQKISAEVQAEYESNPNINRKERFKLLATEQGLSPYRIKDTRFEN